MDGHDDASVPLRPGPPEPRVEPRVRGAVGRASTPPPGTGLHVCGGSDEGEC